MGKYRISQEEFEKILRRAVLGDEACVFPNCLNPARLTVVWQGKRYGLCSSHWSLVSQSDIEWRSE